MYEIRRQDGVFTVFCDGRKVGYSPSLAGARLIRRNDRRKSDPTWSGGRYVR